MSAESTPSPSLADYYAEQAAQAPDNLDAFWLPFTANKAFKARPRLLASASGMYYTDIEGRQILDACAGLWCVNAGHARPRIVEAIRQQVGTLDFAPNFAMASPLPFKLAERLAELAPVDLNHVFFTNSGSESVDSAMKIALAYHRVRGQGQRTRFIGREKAYHGVGFGGISVGGLPNNRKWFGPGLPGVDHLRHTLDLERNAFSKGLPVHGVEWAEELERLITLHDASTIAAVIIEPISGSAGVILPPQGYLQRIRQLCDKHGVLLIFDEVITGFGRVGKAFASQRFGVTPDLMTTAKGLTNGCVPMGAVLVSDGIFETFMQGPDNVIDLFHGYTYSGHPLACAAALATLDTYAEENLFEKAIELGDYWQAGLHSLKGLPHVVDVRNFGLIGAVEFAPRPDAHPGARGFEAFTRAFNEGQMLTRITGDVLALSPPLIVEKAHIDRIFNTLAEIIPKLD
ncbi:aspartate aminotransferase family protein [Pseudoxanthomonas composti]|uniref:Aspartate aminotransferase family protein n=1 Tax=Pseudoxanthomonas composti TaxID=2137479 RepID=A0A4Q1JVP9_9GAMM|nr:aspartate aminotransferase family protein [Pseudoxanthomonas composti]RXR05259.1 aspartate aminotransferase family protein [Pseudoxanthomonas composti]